MAALPSPLSGLWAGVSLAEEAAMTVRQSRSAKGSLRGRQGLPKGGQRIPIAETISGYPPAYEKALVIAMTDPGTVCVVLQHYYRPGRIHPRHEEPYRMGYCHHYREPNEHYHRTYRQLQGCDQ